MSCIFLNTYVKVASNERMMVNYEFDIIWKEANQSYFKVASCSLPG
jgi:hypothetical protein